MKKLRQSTVEPVLGTLINFLAMKRINTRGIKLANKCMIMAAIAYNVKKILRFKERKNPTVKMEMLPSPERCFQNVFSFTNILRFKNFIHNVIS
jgi:hypothetical protein